MVAVGGSYVDGLPIMTLYERPQSRSQTEDIR